MLIYKDIYNEILVNSCNALNEEGGIIGAYNDAISISYHDTGIASKRRCVYIPDTNTLNDVLKKWNKNDITFMGMYHTHFRNVCSLSEGDKTYIVKILNAMPHEIEKLFFPLVLLPSKTIVCYEAKIISGEPVIKNERLTIISR